MKRRLLSILLTFCIVMGILPTTVWADENMDRSQGAASMGAMTDPNLAVIDSGRLNTRISWSISADESTYILMLNGTGPLWDVDNGNKVPSIEHLPWYKYDQSIKQVIIGEGITRIWIENLQGYLDAKISRSISIPSTVTNINGPYNGPYNGTGTKHYGTHTFFKEFVVAAENSVFASKDGVLFSKDMTTLIAYPRDRDGTSYTIPDGTTSILKWAFYQCNLLDIIVPSSVNLVEDYAFDEANSLTKIELPDSITNIGSYAFSGCGNLVDVKLSNNITSILSSTFQFCESLTDITIPVGVTSIEGSAFNGCYNLKNVFIPNGINSIGQGAFRNCTSLDRISIPSSVTSLDPEAFINCKNLANIYYDGNKEDWLMIEYTAEHTSEDGNLYTIPFYGGKTTTALIHYNNAEPDDVDTQKINGTLRSGDSWQLLWECSWKEVDGAPTNGRVDITMTGAANRTDEIYIYNENSNQGFPWELAPHSIPKSAIKTLSISGESVGKRLRVAANSFQGYSNLETVLLDDVTGIDSYAFEGCSALKCSL